MSQCARLLIRKSGFRGFFRGMSIPLVLATPVTAMAYVGNTWSSSLMIHKKQEMLNILQHYQFGNNVMQF